MSLVYMVDRKKPANRAKVFRKQANSGDDRMGEKVRLSRQEVKDG